MALTQLIKQKQLDELLLNNLKNPIDPKFVKCRVGATSKDKTKGIPLFYLDSREVMKKLDEACGIGGWQTKKELCDGGVKCSLSILMPQLDITSPERWITREDYGEFTKTAALKGGSSDSLKRAAMNFGVGRYLYYIPNTWVPYDEVKKKFIHEPTLPEWATPKHLDDWENVAIETYDPEKDLDLDNLDIDFVDEEAKEILHKSQEIRSQIIANLKSKKK